MAAKDFENLVNQIADENLRRRLMDEFRMATKHKKFGLVFEEHLPAATPLYGMKLRRGMKAARRDSMKIKTVYYIERIHDGVAECASRNAEGVLNENI